MTTAYQHKPLSKIIAQPAATQDEGQETPPRNDKGQFVSPNEPAIENEPEKYKGKSREDIIRMHQHAESAYGRSQNEVGQLRGLVSDLATVQRPAPAPTEQTQDVDLTGDELIADPVGAIKKVVQSVTSNDPQQNEPLVDPLAAYDFQSESNALVTEFPDMEKTAMSQEFQDYVARVPSRLADQQTAADPNAGVEAVRAARRLLEGYREEQTRAAEQQPTPQAPRAPAPNDPVAQARAVANEQGHPQAIVPDEVLYESDVIALINSDPEKYRSPSFQAKLTQAIREGRYIKQT